jgi:putative FmdB family regulatory protein
MPTYEYTCTTCGVTFEKRQRFNDAPISEYDGCPNGKTACHLQRLISPPAIVFKGSGFYVTDTRNGNGKTGSSASKTDNQTATGSETKPETKSEKKETPPPATTSE